MNIFVDGSWLFKICKPGAVLAKATDKPIYPFQFSFDKFIDALIKHTEKETNKKGITIGNLIFSTSIFDLPDDFDEWPIKNPEILPEKIELTKRLVHAKNEFINKAKKAGFASKGQFYVKMKPWIMNALEKDSYQEKQVDTTLVALLVKSAFENPEDYHVIVSGDADMLPALRVAYPDYTTNVMVATSHPDELDSDQKHSSYSYLDYKCDIDPFYFQLNIEKIIEGNYIYRCNECQKIFTTLSPVPKKSLPRCSQHRNQKN